MTTRRTLTAIALTALAVAGANADEATYDVAIYGGTSAGVAAAIQVRHLGKTAVLIEPGRHLGGLTSGGLGATDIGNKAAIGGLSREFYRRVKTHYENPAAWKQQEKESYRSRRQRSGEDTMWTFEPHVAEGIMEQMVREADVVVVKGERLDRKGGIDKEGPRILAIRMESGRVFRARRFIDATYEGDLMALAGVPYHVGREGNATYGETLNGVQTEQAVYHQMQPGVDPYVVRGDPSSSLLPGVHAGPPGEEGAGEHRVQAYNLRMCLTDATDQSHPLREASQLRSSGVRAAAEQLRGGVRSASPGPPHRCQIARRTPTTTSGSPPTSSA